MKNQIFAFEQPRLYPEAERLYIRYNRLDLQREPHRELLALGREVHNAGLAGIGVRAVVSDFDAAAFADGALHIDGVELTCGAFERIAPEAVCGGWLYAVTAGECRCGEEDDVLRCLCADTWGTSYADAGRECLADTLRALLPEGTELSTAFGPGFYAMPVQQIQCFAALLDLDAVGIRVTDSGMLLPQKSCVGLYFAVAAGTAMPPRGCADCRGNRGGCAFCMVNH